jgi:hypothetical protein
VLFVWPVVQVTTLIILKADLFQDEAGRIAFKQADKTRFVNDNFEFNFRIEFCAAWRNIPECWNNFF